MPEITGVLTEDEALELFAYLLTSARTQLDDPARYASMRLLSAAEELRDRIADRVSPEVAAMFQATVAPGSAAQEQVNDREVYTRSLDELCALVARTLVARAGLAGAPMADAMLELIRTRRVIRAMSDRPIALQDLEKILEAGRWAPTGGNQRVVRFVAVHDPATLKVLRMVSPGMLQRPVAVIVLCLDREAIRASVIPEDDPVLHIDVGTAMQTMLLAAHALGIGSGPVTSFAHEAVRVVLNLPPGLTAELMVCLGYVDEDAPQVPMRGGPAITWQGLTHWGRYPEANGG